MARFNVQRLRVYVVARELCKLVTRIHDDMPRGHGYLVDQLRRSVQGIANNIAEGAGEFAPNEKIRFYRMALRSATESVAVLDSYADQALVEAGLLERANDLLEHVMRGIGGLIRSQERRARREQ